MAKIPAVRGRSPARAVASPKQKVSITLDSHLVKLIRAQAGEGRVSDWLNGAALLKLQATMIDELIAERGVDLPPELLARVEAAWPKHD